MNRKTRLELPVAIAWACACVAATCMLGWMIDVHALVSLLPGLPVMVPLTAALTLLASWTLCQRQRAGGAGLAPAIVLVAIATLILATYGAERLGLLEKPIVRSGAWGVSSPITASMFLGIGLSLATLSAPRLIRHSQWLALAVLFLSSLTLAGYLSRDTFLYQLLPGTGTSILTSLVLISLSIGSLASRPREGIMVAVAGPATRARIARRLLLATAAMPVLCGVGVWTALHVDLVDTDTAIALLVWGISAFLVVSTWQGALRLGRAEAALEEAMLALREADANKDRFLAVLAHELRNPLAPLRTAADLLRLPAGLEAAQQRRTGDIVARQVDAMSHLIEDLLDVSRIRQGLIAIDRAPVDLHTVAGDAVEQTRSLMAQRGHRLLTELPDVHPRILGDHKRLVQVLANLLVNSARYTPEGGEITLALRVRPGYADIVVRDNGIGIDAAMLGRIFDSFTQAQRNPERGEGGLGLGLSLVKKLVELHGGTVTASSAGVGQGSAFTVTLPVGAEG
ncbi:HAMP domain-containing sensor histidine kinase [uncultured Massilia sp.]|uniref:sensor histidine kinase n=1 Tax=uncultured Massilia sp. TaxID=169973 RepID=UPI0025870566|nr:HAMP domain-containing sensor histidine kinase [uncultured Massilia sp.]